MITKSQPINTLTIATRRSPLALCQASYVKEHLEALHSELKVILLPMTSEGDNILDVALTKKGGKGLFVKELEHSLLNGDADIAVHSMKDVPMSFPKGLGLSVICKREDPRDVFVSHQYPTFSTLPQGALVGTSSLRRQCQLLKQRPDIKVTFLRGNVNTRLRKLEEGKYDAIILAAAGLLRLGMRDRITQYLSTESCLPAGGQGAVGIECRLDDQHIQQWLAPLNDPRTEVCVLAERAMNCHLGGGCQAPIACYAIHPFEYPSEKTEQLWLRGLVGSPDGRTILMDEIVGSSKDAKNMGIALAKYLLAQGANNILGSSF